MTRRSKFPQWFRNLDPGDPKIQDVYDRGYVYIHVALTIRGYVFFQYLVRCPDINKFWLRTIIISECSCYRFTYFAMCNNNGKPCMHQAFFECCNSFLTVWATSSAHQQIYVFNVLGRIFDIATFCSNKKAVLSQRWPRDARYISRPWAVAEIWPFEIIQDGGCRHLEFIRIENSAIRSAVPENPAL